MVFINFHSASDVNQGKNLECSRSVQRVTEKLAKFDVLQPTGLPVFFFVFLYFPLLFPSVFA